MHIITYTQRNKGNVSSTHLLLPACLRHPGEGPASILPQLAEPRKGARFDRRNVVAVQVERPGQEAGDRKGGTKSPYPSDSEESQTPPPPPPPLSTRVGVPTPLLCLSLVPFYPALCLCLLLPALSVSYLPTAKAKPTSPHLSTHPRTHLCTHTRTGT